MGSDVPLDPRIAFQRGDRQAFAVLVSPHLDTVFTLCLRMIGNSVDADDVAQDALARAMEHCHRFDPSREFRPWLLTIAANLCRDRVRSGWWRGLVSRIPFLTSLERAEDVVESAESDANLRRALATLPTHYREAVALFHLEGMTYEEMTLITGVTVGALKQRVRRGTALLREAVEELYPERGLARTVEQRP